MATRWLNRREQEMWTRFIAVVELLPGVLDTQLRRDAGLSHFEYVVLAKLSQEPDHSAQMTTLAYRASTSPSRLSHVVGRLEKRGLVRRVTSETDARVTNAVLSEEGYEKLTQSAARHVETVRDIVLDALTAQQVRTLGEISEAILARMDKHRSAIARVP